MLRVRGVVSLFINNPITVITKIAINRRFLFTDFIELNSDREAKLRKLKKCSKSKS